MSRIAYAAHTANATFYLDESGICCDLAKVERDADSDAGDWAQTFMQCLGGQYVASLDLTDPNGLVHLPRPGASLLFVVTDAHSRSTLVRTGPLQCFERIATIDEDDIDLEIDESDLEMADDVAPVLTVTWPKADLLAAILPSVPVRLAPPPRPPRGARTQ